MPAHACRSYLSLCLRLLLCVYSQQCTVCLTASLSLHSPVKPCALSFFSEKTGSQPQPSNLFVITNLVTLVVHSVCDSIHATVVLC